jgi:tetratricopeptide (TPR) repeat protein
MRPGAGLSVLIAVLLGSPVVRATPGAPLGQAAGPAPGSKAAVKRAKKHFDAAKQAYKAGAYREAVEELNRAVEYDPKGKDLYYNLGLVHEKLGNIDEAIEAYKRYTELETDESELERAIQTLRRLEGARDELKKKEQPAEPPPPIVRERTRVEVVTVPVDKGRKGRLDAWVYTTGGLALVAAGVGTYFGVKALSTRKTADETTGPDLPVVELKNRADRAHQYAVNADIAFAVAGVSAAAAAVLYFARDEVPKDESPRVGAAVVPGGGFVGLRGAF